MKYEIFGDNLQMVILELDGEKVFGEAGSMVYKSEGIKMEAKARGGVMSALGRKVFFGESFFLTEFYGSGKVAFAGNVPGKVIPFVLEGGKEILAEKDAFLCAEDKVNLEVAFQKKLGSVFFGGEGLVIERVYGDGLIFLHACGDIKEIELRQGEKIMVDTGSVVAWDAGLGYDISSVPGLKTKFFWRRGSVSNNTHRSRKGLDTINDPAQSCKRSGAIPAKTEQRKSELQHIWSIMS